MFIEKIKSLKNVTRKKKQTPLPKIKMKPENASLVKEKHEPKPPKFKTSGVYLAPNTR